MLARVATFNSQPADPEDNNVQHLRDMIKSVAPDALARHGVVPKTYLSFSQIPVQIDDTGCARHHTEAVPEQGDPQ